MKRFFNGLAGFIIALCLLSIFSTWTLWAFTALLGFLLYLMFFPMRHVYPSAAMIGALTTLALLDTGRIGREALVGIIIYGLVLIFRDTARFTSEYNRFIVALILTVGAYPLVMLSWRSYPSYLAQLFVSIFFILVLTFFIQQSHRPSDYELV